MTLEVRDREARQQHLAQLYAPVAADLAKAEELLQRELQSKHPFVDQLVRHSYHLGGKRLRPALVLLSAKACGNLNGDHLVLSAVLEMIHTATLVHDDVLDEANMRRHRETVNARWSNEASVLLGDYLFTHAFHLASTLETTYACQAIGRATNIVCEGELRQIESRGNFALTEDEYLSIIEGKTAELCACCCKLGAHYAGAGRPIVQGLARYGRDLGIAFQICDDLLDLTGDERKTGKSMGTDLEKQKLTLPLIRLLDQLEPAARAELIEVLSGPEAARRPRLAEWLGRSDGLEYARERAADFARRAAGELEALPDNAATAVLRHLTEFVVSRQE